MEVFVCLAVNSITVEEEDKVLDHDYGSHDHRDYEDHGVGVERGHSLAGEQVQVAARARQAREGVRGRDAFLT